MIEGDEVVDCLSHEGMGRFGKHQVVGNADRVCDGENDGVGKERIHRAETTNVQSCKDGPRARGSALGSAGGKGCKFRGRMPGFESEA